MTIQLAQCRFLDTVAFLFSYESVQRSSVATRSKFHRQLKSSRVQKNWHQHYLHVAAHFSLHGSDSKPFPNKPMGLVIFRLCYKDCLTNL